MAGKLEQKEVASFEEVLMSNVFIEKWYFKNDHELLAKMMTPLWAHTVQDIAEFEAAGHSK